MLGKGMHPCHVVTHAVMSLSINWPSMSKPHTSVLNVEFCLYGMYVWPCVTASTTCSAGHSYHAPLLPPHARPHLSDTNRWRGKSWPLRLRMKESCRIVLPMHCPMHCSMHCSTSLTVAPQLGHVVSGGMNNRKFEGSFVYWSFKCVHTYSEYGRGPNSTCCWRPPGYFQAGLSLFCAFAMQITISRPNHCSLSATPLLAFAQPLTCGLKGQQFS